MCRSVSAKCCYVALRVRAPLPVLLLRCSHRSVRLAALCAAKSPSHKTPHSRHATPPPFKESVLKLIVGTDVVDVEPTHGSAIDPPRVLF